MAGENGGGTLNRPEAHFIGSSSPSLIPKIVEKNPRDLGTLGLENHFDLPAFSANADELVIDTRSSEFLETSNLIHARICRNLDPSLAISCSEPNAEDLFQSTAISVKEKLIEQWIETERYYRENNVRKVCYLSIEYLPGRTLQNIVFNLELNNEYGEALKKFGYKLEDVAEKEIDPALGNGGLGRLASCFLESMATLNFPCTGYGIRYKYGMFEQKVHENRQVENADYWLRNGHPWEICRNNKKYIISFYGYSSPYNNGQKTKFKWENTEKVYALAYDYPIPGFKTKNTNTLRLWSCIPYDEFDLQKFNHGDFIYANEKRNLAEAITNVLYPNDNTVNGKELRLKQQFFFVSATLQDILSEYKSLGKSINELSSKIFIQLNDTHPTIAIPEFMRILIDEEDYEWVDAWKITTSIFAYTNHTILPEALEKWSVPLLQKLLPRHLEIIYEINHRHLQEVQMKWSNDSEKLRRLSIIEETSPKMVRMTWLSIIGSNKVNGVAKIHSDLVKNNFFPDFAALFPGKFQNKTNGVSPRRWLMLANPHLSNVISDWLGNDEWVFNLDLLENLKMHADNVDFQNQWFAAKQKNKLKLKNFIFDVTGVQVNENSLFDIHAKRFHEYKRQLLNILSCIYRYIMIKASCPEEKKHFVPRVIIFSGKSASAYFLAKCIIHLINAVAEVVNNDASIGDLLKIIFIPNYNVSIAELLIPASDISQQVSTAGLEASGTSNMKFALNGGLLLGSLDGANLEIRQLAGSANVFTFGASAAHAHALRSSFQRSKSFPQLAHLNRDHGVDPRLSQVFSSIESGKFGDYNHFKPILDSLRHGNDQFLISHDWSSYLDAQHSIDSLYLRKQEWIKRTILCTSMMGYFSSDRTIREYANDIWNLKAVSVP